MVEAANQDHHTTQNCGASAEETEDESFADALQPADGDQEDTECHAVDAGGQVDGVTEVVAEDSALKDTISYTKERTGESSCVAL